MTANDKSLASRVSPSITARTLRQYLRFLRLFGLGSLVSDSVAEMPDEAVKAPEPPPLPLWLLRVWPVIGVAAVGWLAAVVVAFTVPALADWRPATLAGLATGLIGTSIFLWQRDAARRGVRGAQTGFGTGG